jgi:hypothetical protein
MNFLNTENETVKNTENQNENENENENQNETVQESFLESIQNSILLNENEFENENENENENEFEQIYNFNDSSIHERNVKESTQNETVIKVKDSIQKNYLKNVENENKLIGQKIKSCKSSKSDTIKSDIKSDIKSKVNQKENTDHYVLKAELETENAMKFALEMTNGFAGKVHFLIQRLII